MVRSTHVTNERKCKGITQIAMGTGGMQKKKKKKKQENQRSPHPKKQTQKKILVGV